MKRKQNIKKQNYNLKFTNNKNVQQQLHKSKITISGIPDVTNENINNICENILEIINSEICVDDIISTQIEKPVIKNNKANKINIRFKSSEIKDIFLGDQKKYGPIIVNQLKNKVSSNSTLRVYFNEFLSTTNKKILYEVH